MDTKTKIRESAVAAVEEENWQEVYNCLHEALLHLPTFAWIVDDEEWSNDELREVCFPIGEAIYGKIGFEGMQILWYKIDESLSSSGSGPLERFWDGCGNGAWQA
ncbi:MAG: hypothetical protein II702_08440 [Clostridia bacterium]|jgi:hypothetical protein|nr:hypothetical protein [Clostridia bacterium]